MSRVYRPPQVIEAGYQLHRHSGMLSHESGCRKRHLGSDVRRILVLPLSRDARKRLRWFYDCAVTFKGNVRKTCRYHGIPPKTFYYWRNRFDITNPRSNQSRTVKGLSTACSGWPSIV